MECGCLPEQGFSVDFTQRTYLKTSKVPAEPSLNGFVRFGQI